MTVTRCILFLTVFIFCFAYNAEEQTSKKFIYDTTNTVIIPFRNLGSWSISHNYKASGLTEKDLTTIDSLYKIAIEKHNSKIPANTGFEIDIKNYNYKRQIIAAINSNGEKEVWINCLCTTSDDRWKSEIVEVDDGGSCFFNLKINVTLRKYYDFFVNGLAYKEAVPENRLVQPD